MKMLKKVNWFNLGVIYLLGAATLAVIAAAFAVVANPCGI
jgi:hypothetical protein